MPYLVKSGKKFVNAPKHPSVIMYIYISMVDIISVWEKIYIKGFFAPSGSIRSTLSPKKVRKSKSMGKSHSDHALF